MFRKRKTSQRRDDAQLALAAMASTGNRDARQRIERMLVEPVAQQTARFCPRCCQQNTRRFCCPLSSGRSMDKRPRCEWRDASVRWMRERLMSQPVLLAYQAGQGQSLQDYFFEQLNADDFFRRWRHWRMRPRASVPGPIHHLGPSAAAVFLRLRDHQPLSAALADVAGQTTMDRAWLRELAARIIPTLSQSDRLSAFYADTDAEADRSGAFRQALTRQWQALPPAEQFVFEAGAMLAVDDTVVLKALHHLGIDPAGRASRDPSGPRALQRCRQQVYRNLFTSCGLPPADPSALLPSGAHPADARLLQPADEVEAHLLDCVDCMNRMRLLVCLDDVLLDEAEAAGDAGDDFDPWQWLHRYPALADDDARREAVEALLNDAWSARAVLHTLCHRALLRERMKRTEVVAGGNRDEAAERTQVTGKKSPGLFEKLRRGWFDAAGKS